MTEQRPENPGQSGNAPGHDPNGPGNSENAPGHQPDAETKPVEPEEPTAEPKQETHVHVGDDARNDNRDPRRDASDYVGGDDDERRKS